MPSAWPGPQALSFLRDIIEHTHEDAPRLVFADWLDEHGRPERAEFIRVQCELAGSKVEDERRRLLQARQEALLKAHGDTWKKEVHTWARQYARFRRGFIGDVRVTAAPWLKSAARLRAAAPLERLEIANVEARRSEVLSSPHLAGLSELTLDTIGADGAAILAASPHLARLKALRLTFGNIGPEGGSSLAGSPHLANLIELRLGCSLIRDEGVMALASSPHLTRLTILDLSNNNISAAGARALAESANFAGLTELNLLCLNRAVWRLDDGSRLGDAGAVVLANSPHLRRLKVLNLRGQEIGPAGARALAASPNLAGLRALDLQENNLGPEGARALADSPRLAGLVSLELNSNGVGDDGALALAASPHLAGLTRLTLGGVNNITEVGASALLDSPHLARLTRLSLWANSIGVPMTQRLLERFGRLY
jgi:uncharacterized protein (TIGR02996 family)